MLRDLWKFFLWVFSHPAKKWHVGSSVWTGPKYRIISEGSRPCEAHLLADIPWDPSVGVQVESMIDGGLVYNRLGQCTTCGAVVLETEAGV